MKKMCFVVLALLALSACSSHYASNGETVYLQSRNGAKLEVPPPLTSSNISYFYDLPPQNQDARVSIAPPMVGITT
ncbi:MAG: hypothetical protein ACHP65_07150 [Legionellales bacterium]